MKLTATILFLFFVSLTFSQNSPLEKANKLIEDRKYASAMKVLNEADPQNQDPGLVIAKSDLVLNYFTKSIMHKIFGLKDLEKNEDLMQLRGGEGNFDMQAFDPDSILNNLIQKQPDNYKLRIALGNYYLEVHDKYPEGWFEPDSIVVQKFKDNYIEAYKNGISDYWSLYGIGNAYLIEKDYKNSIPYFEKSIELKNDYATCHYNLAYAYMYTDQQEKGISSAKKSMDLYVDPDYKSDAAKMMGVMYRELKQNEKSLEYYYQANTIKPNDYNTLKPMLELETALNKETYKGTTKEFFLLAPGNPTIYQNLIQIYGSINKQDELIDFLEKEKPDFKSDNKVNGNIFFYIAAIQYNKDDFKNSKANFETAKEIFKMVYPSDHGVFSVIDSYMAKM